MVKNHVDTREEACKLSLLAAPLESQMQTICSIKFFFKF